ncbi:ATP-binding protein [Streptomyces sp. NPDC028722]|uniref:sensor histidine kinase n=1 Tax=Streptomyces sp. NPDC028722 TaxID=3155016 RepID=UPI0033C184E5
MARQQDRECSLNATDEPTAVRLSEDDLAAVVDALVGNVFRHTPPTTPFAVEVRRTAQTVVLTVDDAGPGIEAPHRAVARGQSATSTGLGLDIAHRAAITSQGRLHVEQSPMGGARVRIEMPLCAQVSKRRRMRVRQRRSELWRWYGSRRTKAPL